MDKTEDSHVPETGRAPVPNVPDSLIWVVRIGGMVALACAAAISAQTLYRLGRLLDFPPETAWLLPAALDVCAGTCIWTAAVIPSGHPGRRRAAIYATLALAFTVISNVLYHAITLGKWTWQDDSLMGVSAIPPIVVEILLHLQTIVTGTHAIAAVDRPAAASVAATADYFDDEIEGGLSANETDNEDDDRQTGIPAETGNGHADPPGNPIGNPSDNDNPPPRQPVIDNPANDKPEPRQRPAAKQPSAGQPSTDTWVAIGKPLYDDLRAGLGKRPGETVFHGALAARVAQLIADGELVGERGDEKPDAYADPSLSTAKRIRGEIETRFPGIMFGHQAPDEMNDTAEEVA